MSVYVITNGAIHNEELKQVVAVVGTEISDSAV